MRFVTLLVLIACWSGVAAGQVIRTPPSFDSAEVYVSAPSLAPTVSGGVLPGGRYQLRHASMVDLIAAAWGIDSDCVVGGPNWMEWDRFDVIAKAAADTSPAEMRTMLQFLLQERFGLTVHADNKPLPTLVLTAGEHPQLKTGDGSADRGCGPRQMTAAGGGDTEVTCRNVTMEDFAAGIPGITGNNAITRPAIDRTGLTGLWSFTLRWSFRQGTPDLVAGSTTFVDAVSRQLGLSLKVQNVTVPVIAVDRLDRKPTETSPADAPGQSAEFEVADIKLSPPDRQPGGGIQPGGRFSMLGFTLRTLIRYAWSLPGEDLVFGDTRRIDTDRFDIIAKAPGSASQPANVQNSASVDPDTLRLMMRALLEERFKLAVHTEDRPVTVFVMSANKPKLKRADPSARIKCTWSRGSTTVGGGFIPVNSYACQNITLGQLAGKLYFLPGSELPHLVVDETGLEGGWDLTVTWMPKPPVPPNQGTGNGGEAGTSGASNAIPAPSDPTGAISLNEALEKQLGLKLALQKRALPVLVVDHVERKPLDN